MWDTVKWKSLSRVRLFGTPWTIQSMEFSRPESWSGLALSVSRRSSQPRIVTHTAGRVFTSWATGKPKNTGVGSLSLLQGIFPIQESNWGLLHCRRILFFLLLLFAGGFFTNWAIREAQGNTESIQIRRELVSNLSKRISAKRIWTNLEITTHGTRSC